MRPQKTEKELVMTNFDKKALLSALRELLNSTTSVRDIVRRHGCSYRGFFQSAKAFEGPIPFESALAKDALRMFELAAEVVMIVPEPFDLWYELDHELRCYTPDYLLYLRDGGRAVAEVKWQAEANTSYNQKRFAAIDELIGDAGAIFGVLTETVLRTPILQRNMSLIESQRHRPIPAAVMGRVLTLLCDGDLSLGVLAEHLGSREIVFAAIGQGILAADLRFPLLNNTLIGRV